MGGGLRAGAGLVAAGAVAVAIAACSPNGLGTIALAVVVSALAVCGLGVALGGWLRGHVPLPLRLLFGAGSVVLLYLEPLWIGIGLAALGVALTLQLLLPKRRVAGSSA